MKKTLIFSFFFCLLLAQSSFAFFTRDHEYFIIKGFDSVDSPITALCEDRIDMVIDGVVTADIPVIHYFEDDTNDRLNKGSYISTHTRGSGYLACLEVAGNDPDLRCFCLGIGLHIVHDSFSHLEGGLVPKYISKWGASNLLGHMIVENDFETKHEKYLTKLGESAFVDGRVEFYDKNVCDNLFKEVGGDDKFLTALSASSGLKFDDLKGDAQTFCNGYKGYGFYNSVYGKGPKLPDWYWVLAIGTMLIGLGVIVFTIIFGKTWWKWLIVPIYLMIFIFGFMILIGVISGDIWGWVQDSLAGMAKVGYLSVSEKDVKNYGAKATQATIEFLKDGVLNIDDATGLESFDRFGNKIPGALDEAEKISKFVIWPLTVMIFVGLNFFLFWKSFRSRG